MNKSLTIHCRTLTNPGGQIAFVVDGTNFDIAGPIENWAPKFQTIVKKLLAEHERERRRAILNAAGNDASRAFIEASINLEQS